MSTFSASILASPPSPAPKAVRVPVAETVSCCQVLQLRHTLGPGVDDQFHVAVVRDKLTRNLAALYPDVLDEITVAFNEYIPAKEDGACHNWTERVYTRTDAIERRMG